jgi:hypothetical protein
MLRIAGINTKNKRRIAGMLSLASQALLVWILYLSDHNLKLSTVFLMTVSSFMTLRTILI